MDKLGFKKISFLGLLSTLFVASIVTLNSFNDSSISAFGNPVNLTKTFNEDNTPYEASDELGDFVHQFDNYLSLSYINAKRASSSHIELGLLGMISKTDQSKGLGSITINFAGDVKVETSYDGGFDNGTYITMTPTSGVPLSIEGNYWRIIGLNSSNIIYSFSITYSCEESSVAPNHDTSYLTNIITDDGYFARIKNINGTTYFTFYGESSSSYYANQILPSDLTLKDGIFAINCAKIRYFSSNRFEAYFDLDAYSNTLTSSQTFYPHIYLRGNVQTLFNASGDLRMITYKGSNKVQVGGYEVNNGYTAIVDEVNWGEENAMPRIHFISTSSLIKYHGSTSEVFDISLPCFKHGNGEVINSDSGQECNNKIKYSSTGSRTISFTFYSDEEIDISSYGIDMSWNNRWNGNGDICYIYLNGSKVLLNRSFSGSWETAHNVYLINGGKIKRGVNNIVIEGIYSLGETNAADEGYELSLYGVVINNQVDEASDVNSISGDDYLKVNGTDIVNRNNEKVYLRGTNMGAYLVYEDWMTYVRIHDGNKDHLHLTNILYDRFGEQNTLDFFETYRNYFLEEYDFIKMKAMNINSIRLPFTYMNVDPDYHNIERVGSDKYNFRVLDSFIALAKKYGIYVTLDLHGAYGSQNGEHHSGQIIDNINNVTFYSNQTYINQTIDLWEAITERYIGEPTIAGFDILNEPGEKKQSISSKHWDVFDEIYDAIRAIDEDRIIIIESTWEGKNLPHPSTYGWENVMYSFHHYTNGENHVSSFDNRLNDVKYRKFNVPVQMGEFTCYGNESDWISTLEMLNQNNWHYNSWSYKVGIAEDGVSDGWGIYYPKGYYIDVDVSDYESIIYSLRYLETSNPSTQKMTFNSGNTLEDIFELYC